MQLRDLAAGLAGARPSRDGGHASERAVGARLRDGPGRATRAVPMRGSLDLRSAWALARLIREQQVEVVHCQKGRARSLALLAGLVPRSR